MTENCNSPRKSHQKKRQEVLEGIFNRMSNQTFGTNENFVKRNLVGGSDQFQKMYICKELVKGDKPKIVGKVRRGTIAVLK